MVEFCLTLFPSFPGCSHPGLVGVLPLSGVTAPVWSLLAPRSWKPPCQSTPFARSVILWRPWTCLCWSHLLSLSSGGSVRGYTAPVGWLRGVFPCFAYCPTSSILKRSSFGFSASSSRWGHPAGSSLSQSSIGTKALPPPFWCLVSVFAMGSPCRVGVCPRSRSERRLFGAPSLVVGV